MCTARFFGLLAAILLLSSRAVAQSEAVPDFKELLLVKRVCVDKIAADDNADAVVREMLFAGLYAMKRFVVTENCDKAEAVVKGAVLERSENRVRGESEGTDFGKAVGFASATSTGGSAGMGAIGGGSGTALFSAETKSSASLTLRIVDKEGTIIWAHTQDSPGGKTKGAISDAVDRALRQLTRDFERAARK